jgi:hypothetical protein
LAAGSRSWDIVGISLRFFSTTWAGMAEATAARPATMRWLRSAYRLRDGRVG